MSFELPLAPATGPLPLDSNESHENLPPMLREYQEYKRAHQECIVLFQVGDFYEIFFDDARYVARALNLTLTSRDKSNPNPVPMCGVPVASVEGYIERLVALGRSVAVVSQQNSSSNTRIPTLLKDSGAKLVVQRTLTRIVTPAIRIHSNAQPTSLKTTVAAVYSDREQDFVLAYSDVQSGKLYVREGLSAQNLFDELARLGPQELIIPAQLHGKRLDRRSNFLRRVSLLIPNEAVKLRPLPSPESAAARRGLAQLKGYGQLGAAGRKGAVLLVGYIDETVVQGQVRLTEISAPDLEATLSIDATTRGHLELVRNSRDGSSDGTLFWALNKTRSVVGERLLRQWIVEPLAELEPIIQRQAAVSVFVSDGKAREHLQVLLARIADLERVAARLELGLVTPGELAALRDALESLPALRSGLDNLRCSAEPAAAPLFEGLSEPLCFEDGTVALLRTALADEPPPMLGEGGVIRDGFNAELDRLRQIKASGKSWMDELERKERERTGINSLKIKFNFVLGYFIEVTRVHLSKIPANYIRRQSTASGERYTTEELKQWEAEVLSAGEKIAELERRLFEELRQAIVPSTGAIRAASAALAQLDVLAALGEVAEREGYVRPRLDTSGDLVITSGKHPVLAKLLESRFVPNSLELMKEGRHCALITGPNMGGKSTFLRQAGLIVIMAQLGSFVPAREARVGLVDRVFARIGASDNLSEGESTFMVEMREASHIISGARACSLVLIDEIGRGTATLDGLSIAQAVLEWLLVRTKCRTLFATHFHELTGLPDMYPSAANLSVGSVEQGEEVIFTHEIWTGPASKSYGIEVAKLAGLPGQLLNRAREIMSRASAIKTASAQPEVQQLELFSKHQGDAKSDPFARVSLPGDHVRLLEVRNRLEALDINSLTPLQALNLLDELRDEIRRDEIHQ